MTRLTYKYTRPFVYWKHFTTSRLYSMFGYCYGSEKREGKKKNDGKKDKRPEKKNERKSVVRRFALRLFSSYFSKSRGIFGLFKSFIRSYFCCCCRSFVSRPFVCRFFSPLKLLVPSFVCSFVYLFICLLFHLCQQKINVKRYKLHK